MRAERSSSGVSLMFTHWELPTPFRALQSTHLVRDGAVARHYSLSPQRTLRHTLAVGRRCFSPTSATDSRYEHPQIVRFPSVRLSPNWPRAVLNEIQNCNAVPEDLAVVRPQVDARLTTRSNFGQITHNATFEGESRAPHRAMLPCRGVINRELG